MKKNIIRIFAMLLAIVWTSCLDDSKYALDPSTTNNVVEFLDGSVPTNPSGAIYPVYTNTTEIVPEFTVELPVSFSGPNGNSEDIKLTLAVDPAALAAYNKQMVEDLGGSTYSLMPDDYYSFTSTSLTIPKGQTKASISVTVFPDKFDLTKNFVVPIRIVSASSGILSAHFSVALVAVVVKNEYDGIYDVLDGQVIRLVGGVQDTNLGGQYVEGLTMDLATINGNTVSVVPLWRDGSGIGGIPSTQFSINQTTNAVTVTSATASMANKPASINEYDPATKTFTVSFDWSQPNRGVYNLKLRYKKPRP